MKKQQTAMKQKLDKDQTELYNIEQSVPRKNVSTNNKWTFHYDTYAAKVEFIIKSKVYFL